ncbi:MAG: GNAT family N-acetyltransferase [Candidatus Hodarchaeales archaeon]|jgi:putative acetyltransferase
MMNVKNYVIREMKENDILDVRRLWSKTGFELTYSDEPEELKRMLKHNPGLCLVAIKKRTIIGVVLGGFDGRRGWVHHLAIDPIFQKKGVGTKLMTELTKRFNEKKVVKIKLEYFREKTEVDNFYKKLGWEKRDELVTMSLTLEK